MLYEIWGFHGGEDTASILSPEDRGSTGLRNVGTHLQLHMMSQLGRPTWTALYHFVKRPKWFNGHITLRSVNQLVYFNCPDLERVELYLLVSEFMAWCVGTGSRSILPIRTLWVWEQVVRNGFSSYRVVVPKRLSSQGTWKSWCCLWSTMKNVFLSHDSNYEQLKERKICHIMLCMICGPQQIIQFTSFIHLKTAKLSQ
jgi:hypothetical protein